MEIFVEYPSLVQQVAYPKCKVENEVHIPSGETNLFTLNMPTMKQMLLKDRYWCKNKEIRNVD